MREDHTQVRAARDRRVLEHLSGDVAAIEAAAAMLSAEATPLARRVSLDLIKAQSARASWLLRAQALLAGHEADRASRSHIIGDVLAGVRDRLAAECRLNGVGLQVTCESRAAVTIDDTLLTVGVTGAVLSLAGLLTGLEGAVIRVDALVEVDGDEDDLQSIEVSQDAVAVPSSLKQRFFDADWVERPGGWLGAIGAAAAEAAAVQLGGGINLSVGNRRGCTSASNSPDFSQVYPALSHVGNGGKSLLPRSGASYTPCVFSAVRSHARPISWAHATERRRG